MPLVYIQAAGTATAPRNVIGDTSGGGVGVSYFEAQGVYATSYRPLFVPYRGDLYLVGAFSRPLVRHALDRRWVLAGIKPPQKKLVVAAGTGSGGSSGGCLCYITFLQKIGDRVMAESDPSNAVDVGTLAGEGRDWSDIDTDAERRVTHVRGYVSMNGDPYRMAWEAPLGLTALTENVPTTALVHEGPDYDHGLPPTKVRYAHACFGRMWYANSPQFPHRLWFSNAGYPQYVGRASFRDTPDREPIRGIWRGRGYLLVFCPRATYIVRDPSGFGDFVIEKLDTDVGCLTHHGIMEIHNKVWIPAEDGVWIYDGGFKLISEEILPVWTDDYKNNEQAFLDGFAYHDRALKYYVFVTNRAARGEWENTGLLPGTVAYACYYGKYEPSIASGDPDPAPDWSLDLKDRFDSSAYYNAAGKLLIASCDGKIRSQDWTNGNDDSDSLLKPLRIRHGHLLFGLAGDSIQLGKTLTQLWAHLESELVGWRISMIGGDEQAWKQLRPDNVDLFQKYDVDPSGETQQITLKDSVYTVVSAPKTVHFFAPEGVSGRGFTFEISAAEPVGFTYRGLGGLWSAGPAARAIVSKTAENWAAARATALSGGGLLTLTVTPSTTGYPVTPVSWEVDFGEGAGWVPVVVAGDLVHTYAAGGDYTVKVRGTDSATPARQRTATGSVHVGP